MIQQSIPAVSTTFLTALASTYSVTAIAAYGVAGKLETILFYPAMALNMVLATIIGQCIGGARYGRAKDYRRCALGYGCGLLVILSVLVVGFAKPLLHRRSDAPGLSPLPSGLWTKRDLGRNFGQPCGGQCRRWRLWARSFKKG